MTSGTDWAEQGRVLVEILRGVLGSPDDHDDRAPDEATAQPGECRWCPLCRLISVLRGERPEGTAALAEVLRATADALHAFAAAADGPSPADPSADGHPADDGAATAAGPPPVVQRIEIA